MVRHIVSANDFSPEDLEAIFWSTSTFKKIFQSDGKRLDVPRRDYYDHVLNGRIILMVFYEPSTRTRVSFEAATLRLGGKVIGTTEDASKFSSVTKGETVEDTVRVLSSYGDAIVLRHNEKGMVATAAEHSRVPIINAGDGDGEHPSQALIDLFTIQEQFPGRNDLIVTFVGDVRHGRTVHSLALSFARIQKTNRATAARMNFAALPPMQIDDAMLFELRKHIECRQYEHLSSEIVAESDVLYIIRPQVERHGVLYSDITGALTTNLASHCKPEAIILHPLPRNNELPTAIDTLPQAHYFAQAQNGLYVCMALLSFLFPNER